MEGHGKGVSSRSYDDRIGNRRFLLTLLRRDSLFGRVFLCGFSLLLPPQTGVWRVESSGKSLMKVEGDGYMYVYDTRKMVEESESKH